MCDTLGWGRLGGVRMREAGFEASTRHPLLPPPSPLHPPSPRGDLRRGVDGSRAGARLRVMQPRPQPPQPRPQPPRAPRAARGRRPPPPEEQAARGGGGRREKWDGQSARGGGGGQGGGQGGAGRGTRLLASIAAARTSAAFSAKPAACWKKTRGKETEGADRRCGSVQASSASACCSEELRPAATACDKKEQLRSGHVSEEAPPAGVVLGKRVSPRSWRAAARLARTLQRRRPPRRSRRPPARRRRSGSPGDMGR